MTSPSLPESGIVRAVALDANVMSGGRLSVNLVEQVVEIIQDRSLEAEIWVPEPVLWEWAEHAHADLVTHVEKHRALSESLADAGLDGRLPELMPDVLDIGSIVRHVEDALTLFAEVRILRLRDHPNCAIGGLKDQILQIGAGRTKGGSGKPVKTGASDGASFRLIEAAAGASIKDVVLVSGDEDARAYFAGPGSPRIFRSWALLRAQLINVRSRGEVATTNFVEMARDLLVNSGAPRVLQSLDSRNRVVRDFLRAGRFLETTLSIGDIRSVEEINDVALSDDGKFATAVVNASADVELTGLLWNDVDDVLEADAEVVFDVPVELDIEARLHAGSWSFSVTGGVLLEGE